MRQSYHSYAKKNGYSLTRRQLMYWAKTHKAAKECGDEKTVEWIENLLEDINYHSECGYFSRGEYEKAIPKKEKYSNNYGEEIEYNGDIFIPYGQFKDKKSWTKLNYSKTYIPKNYSHENFYKKMNNSSADVFIIKNKPGYWVPAANNMIEIPVSEIREKNKRC